VKTVQTAAAASAMREISPITRGRITRVLAKVLRAERGSVTDLKQLPKASRKPRSFEILSAGMRIVPAGFLCAMFVCAAAAQVDKATAASAGQPLEFEVATVKPHPQGDNTVTTTWRGGRYEAKNCSVKLLVEQAFAVPPDEVSGGPDWVEKQRFDITGMIPAATWGQMQGMTIFNQEKPVNQMLQALLKDRFGLVIAHEPKDLTVYALVQARGGAKLRRHGEPKPPETPSPGGKNYMMAMNLDDAPLSSLGDFLASVLGRTVLDQTGLPGNYDIRLEVFQSDDTPADERNAAIIRALEDELGLKLESKKATVDTIQIEHLEEPSEN
jgi:uncharacterized protein (TIGR03435 family)